jgi:hypothetical protein
MSKTSKTRSGILPSSSTKKESNNKVIPGEDDFLRMIELAEYEVNIDPYRGIQSLIAQSRKQVQTILSTGGSVAECSSSDIFTENGEEYDNQQRPDNYTEDRIGWWRSNCSMRRIEVDQPSTQTSTDSSDLTEIMSFMDYSKQRVQSITGSTCPTLIKWIACAIQNQQKRSAKKKRKRTSNAIPMLSGYFGRRHSEDSNKLCICDFNPFCRGTLGGAMDDMLDTLLTERSVMDEVDNDVEGDNTVIVIDDANTSNTTNKSVNIPDDLTLLIDDFYKPQTSERLKRVRKYIQVDEKSIRDYLKMKDLIG